MKPAVVLLSGGLDSATVLAIAQREFTVHALTFRYGQRHAIEIESAKRLAAGLTHVILDLPRLRGSALTDGAVSDTYVPARNTIFLALALGYAEAIGALDIFIGANAIDYSGYPDCRPKFIQTFESLANVATKAGVEGKRVHIHAPLILMTKPDIIRLGQSLGVDYSQTVSCYDPGPHGEPCGRCASCKIRDKAFCDLRG